MNKLTARKLKELFDMNVVKNEYSDFYLYRVYLSDLNVLYIGYNSTEHEFDLNIDSRWNELKNFVDSLIKE